MPALLCHPLPSYSILCHANLMCHPILLYYPTPSNPTDISIAVPSFTILSHNPILPCAILSYIPVLCCAILSFCTILRYHILLAFLFFLLYHPSLSYHTVLFFNVASYVTFLSFAGPSFTPQLSTVLTAAKASGQVKSIKSLEGV